MAAMPRLSLDALVRSRSLVDLYPLRLQARRGGMGAMIEPQFRRQQLDLLVQATNQIDCGRLARRCGER